jgi:uncharacterized protein (TIGR02246 family)
MTMTRVALGIVAALALAGAAHAKGTSSTTAAGSPPLDERLARQLQPSLQAFEDAWNRHDPDAMAAVFADDAVLINPSGRVARGRSDIARLFDDEHQGPLKGTRVSQRLTGARQVAPGLVFLDEDVTISGARSPDGQALPDQHVHGAMLVARQQGGRWQVIEGRPYAMTPTGAPPGVAASPRPAQAGGTGSGATSSALEIEDTPHNGP